MKILALANLDGGHVSCDALQTVLRTAEVAAVVFVGDALPLVDARNRDAGDADPYSAFFASLASLGVPVAIVPGDRDHPADQLRQGTAAYELGAQPFVVVDRGVVSLPPGLIVGGLGGLRAEQTLGTAHKAVPPDLYTTLAPLRHQASAMLLVHTPPQGRVVSCEGNRQVGRRAINDLIEALGVRLVVCGHAHEGQGHETIGPALVVTPGPLASGCYAIIDPLRRTVRFGVLPRQAQGYADGGAALSRNERRAAEPSPVQPADQSSMCPQNGSLGCRHCGGSASQQHPDRRSPSISGRLPRPHP